MKALLLAWILFVVPVFAQGPGSYNPGSAPGLDLAGNWGPVFHEDAGERGPGPELVNYLGIPITDGARLAGLSYDASRFTVPEHQCEVHGVQYIYRGPLNLRIWEERDPVSQDLIAIKQYIDNYEQTRTIWMDGRPHPSQYAPHTWMGFSTGKWEGNALTVTTTHIKRGWIRRNGLRSSDQAVLTEHFIRHGNHLTHISILTDPDSLTEPFIRSQDFIPRSLNGQAWLYPCDAVVEIERPRGAVPHYLPGKNPFMSEFANQYKIPLNAALGGAETMYPEYELKLKLPSAAPAALASLGGPERSQQNPSAATGELEMLPVQGNVYLLAGAGGNIVVQIGPQGTLLVDTGLAEKSDQVLAAIGKLTAKRIQYIINTHVHPDHTGGNDALRKAGTTYTGANVTGNLTDVRLGAQVFAHDNVLQRMSAPTGTQAPRSFGDWPTLTFFGNKKQMSFNGEPIEMLHQPAAHTDGDSIVFFRRSDVIAAGDVFLTTNYPVIDLERGGSIQGEIDALNNIIDIAVPLRQEEGGTYIIPGHGRIADRFEVVEYRDMVTIVRDRIQAAIKEGKSLAQIKAAHLTQDYDYRYGAKDGLGSTDNFVESVYKSLTKTK